LDGPSRSAWCGTGGLIFESINQSGGTNAIMRAAAGLIYRLVSGA
jgi:hypothetical protein